jgi:hypothetical protein
MEKQSRILYTIPQFMDAANQSRAGVYNEINSGRLKTVKIGRRRFVTPQAAHEWINRLEADSEQSAA